MSRSVVVVGAGVAGLAAATALRRLVPDAAVTVLEASDRPGGKVAVSDVAGLSVDEGGDALLARVPDGVDLVHAAGLGDDLVHPAAGQAWLWTRGRMRPLPTGTLLGVPADLRALAASGVLSPRGLARVPLDLLKRAEPLTEDVSVGDLVADRLGPEVVDRLVDPLLGGVYAGRARELSLQATLPLLAQALRTEPHLLTAASRTRGNPPPGPVFAGVRGGLGRLTAALAAQHDVRLGTTVTGLARTPTGWSLTTSAGPLTADGVVLAVPAPAAARLLRDLLPHAAGDLGALTYASVAIVTLVLDGPSPGTGSGYLVPAVDGRTTKAVTFTSRKWGRPGPAVVRASVGRAGEALVLQREDADLVTIVLDELAQAVGPLPTPIGSRVVRWGGGLPQYAVGHPDRVRRITAAVATQPGLAVAGAAYDGVGVPACARSGREAGERVAAALAQGQTGAHDR